MGYSRPRLSSVCLRSRQGLNLGSARSTRILNLSARPSSPLPGRASYSLKSIFETGILTAARPTGPPSGRASYSPKIRAIILTMTAKKSTANKSRTTASPPSVTAHLPHASTIGRTPFATRGGEEALLPLLAFSPLPSSSDAFSGGSLTSEADSSSRMREAMVMM